MTIPFYFGKNLFYVKVPFIPTLHLQDLCVHLPVNNFIAEESYSEMNQQISDFAKRNALLTAYSKQCDQKTEMYTELAKQINDKLTVYKDIAWFVFSIWMFFFSFFISSFVFLFLLF